MAVEYGSNRLELEALDGTSVSSSFNFEVVTPESRPIATPKPPQSQKASISFEPSKSVFTFGEKVKMCFYLTIPAPARVTIHNPARDMPIVFEWDNLGPDGECVFGSMAAGYGHNQLVLEALDGTSASATYEFDVN